MAKTSCAFGEGISDRDVSGEIDREPYDRKTEKISCNGKDCTLSNAVYGAVTGDALGVPFEFMERGSFRCTGMVGFGTHTQPAGTWSDDG